MADIFELAPRYLAWSRRQVRRQSLQRLHARHFIRAHGALSDLGTFGCDAIDDTHISDLGIAIGVGGRGKPITDAVRLQVRRFSITATHGAARCGR